MTPEAASAIRGLRSAFGARKLMVTDRSREWGCHVCKSNGETFFVFPDGSIKREAVSK